MAVADIEVIKLSDCIGPAFYDLWRRIRSQEERLKLGDDIEEQIYELWLNGGRGSLKSSTASLIVANGIRLDTFAHAIGLRRFENELRDSVFAQMKWAIDKLGMYREWKFINRPMEARHLRTGQLILFKGADDPLKLKSLKIPHGYVKYLWTEEADQFRSAADLRNVEQTVFRGEKSHRTLSIYSYNPPKSERAWVNAEVRTPMPGRFIHKSTYLEAPQHWLGKRFIERAEALKLINEPAYNNEYLGQITGTGNEVFKNVHAVNFSDDEIAALRNIRQGLDWGYATNPLAIVRGSFNPKTMVLKIFGEYIAVGKQNRDVDDAVPVEWKRTLTFADSEEPKSCDEMRNVHKWPKFINAMKPKGSIAQGMKWLQGLARIEIDMVRCPYTLNEFLTYCYLVVHNGVEAGTLVDEYPDKNNHTIDGTRYMNQEYIFNIDDDQIPKFQPQPTKQYWN